MGRAVRVMRSSAYLFAFTIYLILAIGLGQRILLWPAIWLLPGKRRRMVRAWLRFHARSTLAMARGIANVRVSVRGAIPPESCIVVMNHQSVLDIPIGLRLVPGPYPLIPTRDRYQWGVPGISPLARLARYPFVSQKRVLSRSELASLTDAAEQVARGEQSLLIFPEGHRSRDGGLGRFMRSGLRIVLSRAERPVYCVAVHGMVNARTFADGLANFANLDVRIAISEPMVPPTTGSDDREIDAFIDMLHEKMAAMLAELDVEPHTRRTSVASSAAHS
jgi:1-acyl-sn-glycerol-3-phosphate acyltransferase